MGLIYLDSCLLIYLVERHPAWATSVTMAIEKAGEAQFAISPLVKCECLVGPFKRADPLLEAAYTDLFECLVVLDLPERVYLQAAHHRARFGLKMPDALHLACAQHHDCEALWTNDNRLLQASQGMAQRVPVA